MKNSPFQAITIELVKNTLKGRLNSFKCTDNTCGLVSKALKSQLKHSWKRRRHCAFAVFSFDPHLPHDMFRQIKRCVCLLYKPANIKFESRLTTGWPRVGLVCQRRVAIETNKGYTDTSYENGLLPCPGWKHFNHALSQYSSGNWFFLYRMRQPDTFRALHCFTCLWNYSGSPQVWMYYYYYY